MKLKFRPHFSCLCISNFRGPFTLFTFSLATVCKIWGWALGSFTEYFLGFLYVSHFALISLTYLWSCTTEFQWVVSLTTLCKEPTHWKRPWCWERLRAGGEGGDRGWDGWMASLIKWTWVWANSRRQRRTGKPGVLQSMGLQRVRQELVTEEQQQYNIFLMLFILKSINQQILIELLLCARVLPLKSLSSVSRPTHFVDKDNETIRV